jgi:hypothetical protein
MVILVAWVMPRERAALAFSEAEVAFLFPAPIDRRGLIHFKLLRSQSAILFTTLILMLVTNRLGGRTWIHAAGWWVILSTLSLHLLGSSFARTMLLDKGVTNWRRRLVILAFLAAVVLAVVLWAVRTLPQLGLPQFDPSEPLAAQTETLKTYLRQILISGPLPWLLYPFRLVVGPYLAPDARAFLVALVPALFLLVLHYWWVIQSNVAFEEASVEASKKLAEKIAAMRGGRWQDANRKLKVKRPPFELRPVGPRPVALLWKNLISAGNAFTLRTWILLAVVGVTLCTALGSTSGLTNLRAVLGMISAMLLVWSLMLGPQILRQDFRQDLPLADVLKSYPLRGWQLALGELLGPAAILTGIQWILLLITVSLLSRSAGSFPTGPLVTSIGLGAALVVPMLNLITLQIPNAAVLLFPAWIGVGKESAQGIEATGQRIIFLFGQVLVFIIVLIPAAVVFTLLFFLMVKLLLLAAPLVIPVAAFAAAIVLAAEAGLGMFLLGWLFERFDVSAESTP